MLNGDRRGGRNRVVGERWGGVAQGSLWPAHSVLKDGDLTSIVSKPVAVTCQLIFIKHYAKHFIKCCTCITSFNPQRTSHLTLAMLLI